MTRTSPQLWMWWLGRRPYLAAIAFVCLAAAAQPADNVKRGADGNEVSIDGTDRIRITKVSARVDRLDGEKSLIVLVKNVSDQRVRLEKLRWRLDRSLLADEEKEAPLRLQGSEHGDEALEAIELDGGEVRLCEARFPSMTFRERLENGLLFVAGSYNTMLLGQVVDQGARMDFFGQLGDVTVIGPAEGVIAGGFAGIVFALAFILLNTWRQGTFRATISEELIQAGIGLIAVFIVILVLRYSSVTLDNLPITVNVKDGIGGFVIGLFYKPMVPWFQKWFSGGQSTTPTQSPSS